MLGHLDDVQRGGQCKRRRRSWHWALRILEEIGHPDADLVRAGSAQ
jgi:hypothetical protein